MGGELHCEGRAPLPGSHLSSCPPLHLEVLLPCLCRATCYQRSARATRPAASCSATVHARPVASCRAKGAATSAIFSCRAATRASARASTHARCCAQVQGSPPDEVGAVLCTCVGIVISDRRSYGFRGTPSRFCRAISDGAVSMRCRPCHPMCICAHPTPRAHPSDATRRASTSPELQQVTVRAAIPPGPAHALDAVSSPQFAEVDAQHVPRMCCDGDPPGARHRGRVHCCGGGFRAIGACICPSSSQMADSGPHQLDGDLVMDDKHTVRDNPVVRGSLDVHAHFAADYWVRGGWCWAWHC